jgi:hypothetical protein
MREGARPKRSEATTQGGMRGWATSEIWAGTATQTDPALSSTRDGQLWCLWEPSTSLLRKLTSPTDCQNWKHYESGVDFLSHPRAETPLEPGRSSYSCKDIQITVWANQN